MKFPYQSIMFYHIVLVHTANLMPMLTQMLFQRVYCEGTITRATPILCTTELMHNGAPVLHTGPRPSEEHRRGFVRVAVRGATSSVFGARAPIW